MTNETIHVTPFEPETESIDKAPKYQFAVYSKRDGVPRYELESSAADEWRASRMFDQYKTWGMTDTTFIFVDWQTKKVLGMFRFQTEVR